MRKRRRKDEYFIEFIPIWKRFYVFFLVLALSTVLFGALAATTWTFWPYISSYFIQRAITNTPEPAVQLPENQNRLIPFSTPDPTATPNPNIIVQPYPAGGEPLPAEYLRGEQVGPNRIVIPAINVNVPVVESPSLNDKDIIATLERGAALYPNGVTPGALGNAFIAAHSSGEPWKGIYRFAFTRINELQPGDVMYVEFRGTRYSYRITTSEIITPTPEFQVVSDRPVPTISLMACWPIWSTKQRILIHAELTNVTQLTKPAS